MPASIPWANTRGVALVALAATLGAAGCGEDVSRNLFYGGPDTEFPREPIEAGPEAGEPLLPPMDASKPDGASDGDAGNSEGGDAGDGGDAGQDSGADAASD